MYNQTLQFVVTDKLADITPPALQKSYLSLKIYKGLYCQELKLRGKIWWWGNMA
jgi:hypothetical protein